jgi:hypothetical protein
MESLPNEIVLEIISWLPNYDLQEFGKTSKTNCQLSEVIWKRKYMNLVDGNPRIGFYKDLLDNTKLVYYYRKYTRGLQRHLVHSQNELMKKINQKEGNGNLISLLEKNKLVYETFDIYVKFKDILLHHRKLLKVKEIAEQKLKSFLFPEKNTQGDRIGLTIGHKYYPLLFPENYYWTLIINIGYHNQRITDKYGMKNDFCLLNSLLLNK